MYWNCLQFGIVICTVLINANDTIDGVLSSCPDAARTLSKLGIDFCSDGSRTIKDACAECGVPLRKLRLEISKTLALRDKALLDPSTANFDELTRHIERYHHQFTSEVVLFIKTSLNRLARLHEGRYPELAQLKDLFDEISGPLMIHMQHEEFIVFPYIRELVKKGKRVKTSIYKSAGSPIPGMLAGHDQGPIYLKRLSTLSHQFSPPNEEGSAFKVTYAAMRELERDLNTHLRLESEILFPRALELEIRINVSRTNKVNF